MCMGLLSLRLTAEHLTSVDGPSASLKSRLLPAHDLRVWEARALNRPWCRIYTYIYIYCPDVSFFGYDLLSSYRIIKNYPKRNYM